MNLVCVASAVLSLVSLAAAEVVSLSGKNFDQVVGGSLPVMVKFSAPWCGHCKTLKPIYEKLSRSFSPSKVVIAEVDTDQQKSLAKRFDIKGLPTILWFDRQSSSPQKYGSGRDIDSLVQFVKDKTGLSPKGTDAKYTVDLGSADFDRVARDMNKNVLVDFFAPWCGHCQKLAPIYEQLGQIFKNEENCVIAKVNGDVAKDIVKREGIRGYPTVKMYLTGGKVVEVGERTLDRLVAKVNFLCGTQRTVSGKLSKSAGILPDMAEIVKSFVANPAALQETTVAMFQQQEKSSAPNTSFIPYAQYMEKVQKEGTGFIGKELERLTALINGSSVDSKKADEFAVRRNILAQFAEAADIKVPDYGNADLVAAEEDAVPADDEASEEIL